MAKPLQLLLSSDKNGDLIENFIHHIYSQWVDAGDFVIDGGSADGRHTLPLSHLVGPSGIVLSVEPLFSIIYKHRAWANNYQSDCVIIKEVALSDYVGTSTFNCIRNNPGYSGLKQGYWASDAVEDKVSVNVFTIDELMKSFHAETADRTLTFIKLDLEGGEYNALMGGLNTLKKFKPLIIFEHARNAAPVNYGYHPNQLFNMAKITGYSVFDVIGGEYFLPEEFSDNTPGYLALVPNTEQDKFRFRNIIKSLDKFLI